MSSLPLAGLPFAPPPFSAFIGPAFMIISCALILYGVFCAQTYYYWTNYRDHVLLRCVVGLLMVLETAHTALCMHLMYSYLVDAWGNVFSIIKVIPTVGITIYLELIISSIVQAWYIYRIWRLRRQIVPIMFLVATLLAHVGTSFRAAAYTNQYATWIEVYSDKHFTIDSNCSFGLNIALDASITSILIIYLLRDRSKAVRRSTRSMTSSLMNFAFSTGILTVLTSCGLFVALNVAKHTLTFGGMVQFIAKLYANSMLAVLNARNNVIQAATSSDTKFGLELSNMQASVSPSSGRNFVNPIQIRTETTVLTASSDTTWVDKQNGDITYMHTVGHPTKGGLKTPQEEV
ncbi:hypothetical protein BC629DRAFT_190817 [Irpex lacteus]|nr:hypothetical protein BC629DRAFT_190817 [Irpex lacteus]